MENHTDIYTGVIIDTGIPNEDIHFASESILDGGSFTPKGPEWFIPMMPQA